MVRNQSKTVLSRELIIRKTEMLHAQFRLYEIDKSQREVLRLGIRFLALLRSHLYGIGIVIIAIDRPVDHVLSVRSPSVRDHHLRSPPRLTCLHLGVLRIDRTVVIWFRIISFRLLYSHICIRTIILEHCNESEILDHVIRLFRSDRLPCINRRFHSYPVFHAACLGHIAEFSTVNKDICSNDKLLSVCITENDIP